MICLLTAFAFMTEYHDYRYLKQLLLYALYETVLHVYTMTDSIQEQMKINRKKTKVMESMEGHEITIYQKDIVRCLIGR